ncbi:sensor histidine kinase [Moorena bouillonii]|uniref:Histidine kinase n=1 Tax=Moorena bouillonii PNG TaxID=568701 RepID=A0A1U7MXF0_9CYAN|nr:CHASE2 domain-containing protein [Moorena bouillonii]OLT58385.1 histidine kinase [Moorena bouillonii PNG]
MVSKIRKKINTEIAIWRQAAVPGIAVIIIVVILRLIGSLQFFEWIALDTFLRLRPGEPTDDKVVVVGINEEDIRSIGRYPIPDGEIAELIQTIEEYQPIAIGLDIVRDIPIEPDHAKLTKVFQQHKNLIGIEKILPPDQIPPPPELPKQQVGFSDMIADQDGQYRRYLLWTTSPQNPQNPDEDKYSLSLRVAQAYLSAQGINIETGISDPNTIRFDTTEITRFLPNSGGYIRGNDSGLKILVNFRSGKQPFTIVSLKDIQSGQLDPKLFHKRIVLIGITAQSVPDLFNTSVVAGSYAKINGQIYGVEFHAHVISQIINGVFNNRAFLNVWHDKWENLWIIIWGIIPIIIARITQSIWKNILAVGATSLALIGITYLLIVWGWWVSLVPGLLILVINGLGLSAFAFYQHDQGLKSQIKERQRTIKHTFDLIHAGPLQTLAHVLKHLRSQDAPQEQLLLQLEKLNHEIREIGEYLNLEALTPEESIRLGSGLKLELKRPIHELFYQVYTSTLERDDLEYLKTLKVKIRAFDPIDDKYLILEQRQELCLFLEEALCNVGKHAKGVKRVEATGKENQGWYTLSIKDNGSGMSSFSESKGTQLLKNVAKSLGGDFRRESLFTKGTLCELTWQLTGRKSRRNQIKK